MRSFVLAVCTLALNVAGAAAQRPDSAAFVVRLGTDTTAIERYVRTRDRIEVEAVQRAPRTMLHRMTYDLDARGRVRGARYEVRRPDGGEPIFVRTITFVGDSARIETTQGSRTSTQRVAARDAIPVAGPFFTPYELATLRAAGGKGRNRVTLLTGGGTVQIPVERSGDTVRLTNQFEEPMRARVDARGRILRLDTPAYTSVERLGWVDLPALAREFAGRDAVGRAMGPLSPRSTSRERVGEANLWIDYSRPAMRGRPVWGGLVPWGQVWRMGANDAAHFATDRMIEVGGLTLPPGTYTLFLLPAENGEWQLIFNRATGMSGLDYDPTQDVGRVPLRLEQLNDPVEQFTLDVHTVEGTPRLMLAWDRTRAFVPFRVR